MERAGDPIRDHCEEDRSDAIINGHCEEFPRGTRGDDVAISRFSVKPFVGTTDVCLHREIATAFAESTLSEANVLGLAMTIN